jgi:hypothetical protein
MIEKVATTPNATCFGHHCCTVAIVAQRESRDAGHHVKGHKPFAR